MSQQLPLIHPHNSKGYRGKTVAERVSWMTRTSDVYGSYDKTDLESYLTLIRRKVQEKCTTCVDLMNTIRRLKISDAKVVTPIEFRFTLIKFGITLAQPLVDRIFNVFDSDRSGTMDFDEFATWIMNSEFKPKVTGNPSPHDPESPEQHLRRKFLSCVRENLKAFENLNKQVSFTEFISLINRKNMKLTEKEARSVFQILDYHDTGFVSSNGLIRWAETGSNDYVEKADRPPEIQANSVGELCGKVVGRNTKALESAFSHVQRGSGTRLPFEEFRRCLLNAGVGKNIYDVQQLFQALGGSTSGSADIDLFFKHLSPIVVDPRTEINNKAGPTSIVSIGRADRHLRDAIRKSYKIVKQEIKAKDPTGSGFIEPDALYAILVKKCIPLTFQDFRFLTQQMKKGPGGIDYEHFLQSYNPTVAHHELDGSTLSRSASLLMTNTNSDETLNKTFAAGSYNQSQSVASLAATAATAAKDDISVGTKTFLKKTPLGVNSDLKRVWHIVLKECHRVDPERNGQVSRATFISALQKADTGKTMTLDSMNKLADDYILSNGMVNYLYCFRNYLGDITSMGSSSGAAAAYGSGNVSTSQLTSPSDSKPLHPWDYEYKREKHADPYWQTANTLPKESQKLALTAPVTSAQGKSTHELSSGEKEALLAQYNEKVISVCAKSYKIIAPLWRQVRSQLKKRQVANQRGSILAVNFIAVLEDNGIILDKKEIGTLVKNFRGTGLQEVVKYDEFFKVCLLAKDMSP